MLALKHGAQKYPYDIPEMFRRIRQCIKRYPKAMLSTLVDDGYDSPFELLVACLISIRTFDEISLACARRLFKTGRTPAQIISLGVRGVAALIKPSSFAETKARRILDIAHRTVTEFNGKLPCDPDVLLSFTGVGPKCANLVMGLACDTPSIGVDIHVHRVTNRWGYVNASTSEKTLAELRGKLPRRYWIDINRLLVPFGKHICTGRAPKCSECPVLDYCQQVGVTTHR
jgi:endonuclease-3